MATILAIDFGNENSIVALPSRGGVEILSNQSSQRATPSMVAFTSSQRFAGIFAQQNQMQNIPNTLTNLKRLVGVVPDSQELTDMQSICPFQFVASATTRSRSKLSKPLNHCGLSNAFLFF
jgi:molecular chaperone DnaK (HSP70)